MQNKKLRRKIVAVLPPEKKILDIPPLRRPERCRTCMADPAQHPGRFRCPVRAGMVQTYPPMVCVILA